MIRLLSIGVIFTALLAGCGSTPSSNHYVISAQTPEPPLAQSPALGIGPIQVPEYLNRNSMVFQGEGNQLRIVATERWAEPLEDGITRALGMNLASLLKTENVRSYPWHPARAPDYGVKLRVLALDANSNTATLVAEWLVFNENSEAQISRRISKLQRPLGGGQTQAAQAASAYSALLQELSELIAQVISGDIAGSANPQ